MDKAHHIPPREAMLDRSQRTPAVNTPELVQDGLRPMRCSSTAQSSTLAGGKAVATCRAKGEGAP